MEATVAAHLTIAACPCPCLRLVLAREPLHLPEDESSDCQLAAIAARRDLFPSLEVTIQ